MRTDEKSELGTAPVAPLSDPLPEGVVTILLIDIEGSSRLWEKDPAAMRAAVALHDELLEDAMSASGGARPLDQGEGDSAVAAFTEASHAISCALEFQRGLAAAEWPEGCELRLRAALHSGEVLLRDERNYVGSTLNRCARLRALAHGGQTLLSRATCELVADVLPEDADLKPLGSHRLRDLTRAEEIFELVHPELRSDFAPPRSPDAVANNLPVQLSSFVGRQTELAQAGRLLAEHRLLTLTGAGGCGKTRLAVQAAAETLERFPDGAWWVELAPLAEERLVGAAIAEALDVRPLPGVSEIDAAGAYLAERRALLILDNCEHMTEACAEAAEALLRAAPGLTVMATSRAPLGVTGETDWRVPSLALPGEDATPVEVTGTRSDAVELFIERAREADPDLRLTDDESVAVVCDRLDGLPLAIELAAARVRVLSVQQIESGLADRFRLLSAGPRTALPRLKTLRASVDWSHELLSDDERALLRRLSAFAGSFSLEATEVICADGNLARERMLDLLGSLVDQSLVNVERTEAGTRYRLLETVRQYGLERLVDAGEQESVRERHRDYFLALAERAGPNLETARQREFLEILDPEAANLAAAIEFALQTAPPLALRLSTGLNRWWCARGRIAEAELAYSRSLEACEGREPALRARALERWAWVAIYAGDAEAAASRAADAIELAEEAGDGSTAARARCELGLALTYGDPRLGRRELERAVKLARAAGDDWGIAEATQLIALGFMFEHDHAGATKALKESGPLVERLGDPFQLARHPFYCGWIACMDGRIPEAREAAERTRAALVGVGEPLMEGLADFIEGTCDIMEGEPRRALELLQPGLDRSLRLGSGLIVPTLINTIALAELALGRFEEVRARVEGLIPLIEGRDRLHSSVAFERLAEAQRLLSDDGAEATALKAQSGAPFLNHPTLARLAAARGEWSAARERALSHLGACVERGHATFFPACLDALAEATAGLEAHEDAARLFGAADRARGEIGVVRVPPEAEHWAAIETKLREVLGEADCERARAEGEALSVEEAVEWARRGRGSRSRPPSGWESLTPTECKVVELVVEGLTNPQIAERMFVTTGTVKTHVAHIFSKLDLHSRAELGARAAGRRAVS